VFIHGGSFAGGTKTSSEIVDMARTFARKGYVTASISYRLDPVGCLPGGDARVCLTAITQAKDDAQSAIRWLRANAHTYGIDTRRIAVGGSSAGAITALNVGLDPAGVVGGANQDQSSAVLFAMGISGAGFYPADPGDATLLDFHGTADTVVPFDWGRNTIDQASAQGNTAFLTSWTGDGHVPYTKHRRQIIDETTNLSYWALALYAAAA
jgi:poly(3-hydroxybutyrate) depolymerase